VQSLIQVPDFDIVFLAPERFQLRLYYAAGHNYAGRFFMILQYLDAPFQLKTLSIIWP
jgi:hypothetical protein